MLSIAIGVITMERMGGRGHKTCTYNRVMAQVGSEEEGLETSRWFGRMLDETKEVCE